MTTTKHIITLITMLVSVEVFAQGSRILPILEAPQSASSLAMAGIQSATIQGFEIYNNPASLSTDSRVSTGYSLGVSTLETLHTASFAYRLAPKHALMFGARYSPIDIDPTHGLETSSYTTHISLGYSHSISDRFTVYAIGNFAQERVYTKISAYLFDVGLNYKSNLRISNRHFDWDVSLIANNLGQYSYSSKSGPTSPLINLNASLGTELCDKHSLLALAEVGYWVPVKSLEQELNYRVALKYQFMRRYALVGGYSIVGEDKAPSVGVMARVKDLNLEFAYRHKYSDYSPAYYMLSLCWYR